MKKFEKINNSKFAGATLNAVQMNSVIGGVATPGGSRCNGTDCGTYSSDSQNGSSTTWNGWKATSSDASN